MDVGAVEADWRGRYGRDIGSRMEVNSASPADGTSKLTLGEEERLLDAGTHTIRVSVNQAGPGCGLLCVWIMCF